MSETCRNCINWQGDRNVKWYSGKCHELKMELEITLSIAPYSNGGIVDYIETEPDFGCIKWEENK